MFDLIPVKVRHLIMGIILTVLLVALQIIGFIEFSWWLLFIPLITPFLVIISLIIIALFIIYRNTNPH